MSSDVAPPRQRISRRLARREARHDLDLEDRFMGVALECAPAELIEHVVALAAGELAYINRMLDELHEEEQFETPAKQLWVRSAKGRMVLIERQELPEVISRWAQLRVGALERAARFAKIAHDMGIDERRLRIEEQQAAFVVTAVRDAAREAGLDRAQVRELGEALRRSLEALRESTNEVIDA